MVLDVLCGEPPAAVHPVVWMGRLLQRLERHAPQQPMARLVFGAAVATGAPLLWATVGLLAQRVLPWPLQAVVLKPTFAGRDLLAAGQRVATALEHGDLDVARVQLRGLVSRPTSDLSAALIAAATIESVAENLADSWVAPLLAYAVGGLPLAYAYRTVNTADAMWGYRTPRYEYLGKTSARLDDALNWLPARLAAALLVLSSGAPGRSLRVWQRDAPSTASPNAGQPMAAAAGALNVRLEKVDHYMLNAAAREPLARDIAAARALVRRAMLATTCLALAVARARRA